MAVELLTVVTHPDNPDLRIAPDRYFAEVAVRHRVDVIKEQLQALEQKASFFQKNDLLASVNVDGPTLLALRQHPEILAFMERHPGYALNLLNISVCRKRPRWHPSVSLAHCGWTTLVQEWRISLP